MKQKAQAEELKNLLEQYKKVVDVSSIVSKTDTSGLITYVNEAFCKISGYTPEELLGKPHSIIRHPENSKILYKNLWDTIQSKQIFTGTLKNINKRGETYYVNTTIVPILGVDNEIIEYISIRNDVTELVMHKHLLREQMTDSLTRLPNRLSLIDTLTREKRWHLIILDIDKFRHLNEVYGYRLGDALLISFTLAVNNLLWEGCRLYRLSADNFAVLVPDRYHQDHMVQMCETIYASLADTPLTALGESIGITVTFGISTEKSNLVGSAEIAHEHAKKHNLYYTLYSSDIEFIKMYESNLQWIGRFKAAVADNRLVPHFQGIVDNRTGRCEKYEVLIRLKDEEGVMQSPVHFMEVARSSKLYRYVTDAVLGCVEAHLKTTPYSFSINITQDDAENHNLTERICALLERCGDPSRVTFELLESENIEHNRVLEEFIARIKALGAKLAIDDFGTGYSNFKYMADLEVDYIKIDGSIIRNILEDKKAHAIARSISNFAQELGIKTVAEYVASEPIYDEVRRIGIDYSQGYFFGAPSEEFR